MRKYVCMDCGLLFDTPNSSKLDEGMKYGTEYLCCPECDSFDIDETEDDEDEME